MLAAGCVLAALALFCWIAARVFAVAYRRAEITFDEITAMRLFTAAAAFLALALISTFLAVPLIVLAVA